MRANVAALVLVLGAVSCGGGEAPGPTSPTPTVTGLAISSSMDL